MTDDVTDGVTHDVSDDVSGNPAEAPNQAPTEAPTDVRVDGRTARAERTRRAIVDALLALTAEGVYKPTAERIVERAGVSLRTLWTNFRDLENLYTAAGERLVELTDEARRPIPATLPLPERVAEFCRQRARVLEIVAPAARASALRLPFSRQVREYRAAQHARARTEVLAVFGPELGPPGDGREQFVQAILVASSWSAWSLLRDELHLDVAAATGVMNRGVLAVLAAALSQPVAPKPVRTQV